MNAAARPAPSSCTRVASRSDQIVGADDVAEEGARGFSHELLAVAHSKNDRVEVGRWVGFSEDLPAEVIAGARTLSALSARAAGDLLALDHVQHALVAVSPSTGCDKSALNNWVIAQGGWFRESTVSRTAVVL